MGGGKIRSGRLRRLWRDGRTRILFWTGLVALLFGVLDLGQPIEQLLYLARTQAQHKASGDIVIVGIDDKTLAEYQQVPLPRHVQAALADRLRELGARRVFYDFDFSLTTQPKEDQALATALERLHGRGTIAVRFVVDPLTKTKIDSFPHEMFRKHAHLGTINVQFMAHGTVWTVPYALTYGGHDYPSFAASLSGVHGRAGEMAPIDYSIDPASIPLLSAADVLDGTIARGSVEGKDILVGATSLRLGDEYQMPSRGAMPGVYGHVLGAETLKAGRPLALGWQLPLLLALALAAIAINLRR